MDINFKKFFQDMTTTEIKFYLPTLRLHFLDGEVRDVLPTDLVDTVGVITLRTTFC